MRTRAFLRNTAVAALLLVTACDDDTPLGPPEGGGGGAPSSVRTFPRFGVEMEATGSFRPGQPIQITLTAEALIPTPEARLEIVLPEEASARMRGGFDNYRRARETRLPASASRTVSLGRRARAQERYTVTFDRPGYYSVWGSARSDTTIFADSGLVQNEAHKVLYIYVDERGGRVTERFDPTLLPATAAPELGPLREHPGVRVPPANLPRPGGPGAASGPASSSARRNAQPAFGESLQIVVDYYNASAGSFTPVGNAQYLLRFYNENFTYLSEERAQIGPSGQLTLWCDEAYYVELSVYSYNSRVSVGDATDFTSGKRIAVRGIYPQSECPRGIVEPTVEEAPAHVFVSLDKTAQNATSLFGRSRPQVKAVIVNDAANPASSYCPTARTPGCPHGVDDYLRINAYYSSTSAYGDQIWGRTAAFVQAHEYGHAFHEKALGGFSRYYVGCGYHALETLSSNMGCALLEGFADYFAVAARPGETGYEGWWESNHFYMNHVGAGKDGSLSEAAVASFFWDLTDGGTETHDIVQYAGSAVAEVISTCKVLQSGTYVLNTGIDHLVYCFERKVDPAVTGSTQFFTTRSPDPTGYTVTSGTVMNAAEVRKLWRKNLYNQ